MAMMKFSIPTNFQDDLFCRLDPVYTDELYGKLDNDAIGGGRPSFMLPRISRRRFALYLEQCKEKGVKFNYLLNATCLGNTELTRRGQKELRKLLTWLIRNNVYAVTVSIPYLLEFVKHNYPALRVYVSTMAGVDSLQKAKYWESLGADRITLSVNTNRNFKLLGAIRENVRCQIQVIANLFCLYDCPFWMYHSVAHSHASQSKHQARGFLIDYCFLKCNYIKIKDPVEFIRSGWIRPEDLGYYEELGIDRIKFANRDMSTERIAKLIDAYRIRDYNGNLIELFNDRSRARLFKNLNKGLITKLRYFFRPFSVNIFALSKLGELLDDPGIYIENKALDGFLEHLIKEDCRMKSCATCNYCQETAGKALRIDKDKQLELIKKYEIRLKNIFSGDFFRYLPKK